MEKSIEEYNFSESYQEVLTQTNLYQIFVLSFISTKVVYICSQTLPNIFPPFLSHVGKRGAENKFFS